MGRRPRDDGWIAREATTPRADEDQPVALDPDRVQAVFLAAVACLDGASRAAVLDRECSSDAELRGRVEALLKAVAEPNELLDRPIVGPAGPGVFGGPEPGPIEDAPPRPLPATDLAPGTESAVGDEGGDDPSQVGRYRIIRRLGQGGFGRVYLASDDDLDRPVAIKIPHPARVARSRDRHEFLAEARILARLDHPHIVPVFDVGWVEDGPCFVVSKYVEGSDLAVAVERARPPWRDAAGLVATIADALDYAHSRGLVHRDIKPANILIDAAGRPCLADFGIALKDEDFGKGGEMVGTPFYMSPEQARGEGHRVDPRSDVFSLGVVLYELLFGRRPFQGDSLLELIAQITFAEPPPPRIDPAIPGELGRICLKALAKRASERYGTAREMAEDLRLFLRADGDPTAGRRPRQVVPKGLRSFDEADAGFFLELLPGPRDRDGLPGIIGFWKRAVERFDPARTFKVAVIYGPSGSGKSSIVKAGLLPRLGEPIVSVYIETTPDETEAQLLNGVLRACPGLPAGVGLVASLADLRKGRALPPGRKVLLVLDQFEQWLSAGGDGAELTAALRQCDGERLQALLIVRDDFWMAATRFMKGLEIPLSDGENAAAIDLFDVGHARQVLAAFGRAYGRLPDDPTRPTPEQRDFVEQAANILAGPRGEVIPVHLALFVELMKRKEWTRETLRESESGGTRGLAVAYLEETFEAPAAPRRHHRHRNAAQAVLKALLPESGSEIKARMMSRRDLLEVSGYADRDAEFDDLLHLLDHELRLITAIVPEPAAGGAGAQSGERCYLLSHDFLVPRLRDWLAREQSWTRRGRAEMRLAERASIWDARPDDRYLPGATEWAGIRLYTSPRDWTEPQERMMARGGRVHGRRLLASLALASLMAWAAFEGYGAFWASSLVESLRKASTPDVPTIVAQLPGFRRWTDPQLARMIASTDASSREHLHASLALLDEDATQVEYLYDRLRSANPGEFAVLRDALDAHRPALIPRLWDALERSKPGDTDLLPVAGALASYDPDSTRWDAVGDKVARSLVTVDAILLGPWTEAMGPVRARLLDPITAVFRDGRRPESERTVAASILADFAREEPARLADLLMAADARTFPILFPVAEKWAEAVMPIFRAEISRKAEVSWGDAPLDPAWAEPTADLVGRIERAQGAIAARFGFCQLMPLDEFLRVVEALRGSGYRPVRFRPFADGETIRVAAVWARDGRRWRVASGLTADEARRRDHENRDEGFLPVDVAGYRAVGETGELADRYSSLWVEESGGDQARMYVGATEAEQEQAHRSFEESRLVPRLSHSMIAADGAYRHCGVWGRPSRTGLEGRSYRGLSEGEFAEILANPGDHVLIDVAIGGADATGSRLLYSATSCSDWWFEAATLHGPDPVDHLRACRDKIAEGFRPVSWSVHRPAIGGRPLAASVWHRPVVTDEARDRLAMRQARAAVALARLGRPAEILPLIQHAADPRLRSFVVNWLAPLGADPSWIIAELDRTDRVAEPTPAGEPSSSSMEAILFHPETSRRRALILALGTYAAEALPTRPRQEWIGRLLDLYRDDPDAGIHGAAEWALGRWGQREKLEQVRAELMRSEDRGQRRWHVNGQGQTFALIEGPLEFRMGSPPAETERIPGKEPLRGARIPHRFAIATKEVSVDQFQRFLKVGGVAIERYQASPSFLARYSPDPAGPWVDPDWYMAAHYCNWLSEQEGLPRDQWCYLPDESGAYGAGMSIPGDVMQRAGYRLPTESEWEYACRAGAITSRSYGHSIDLLPAYARFQANSEEHAWACGGLLPNDLGLFDMLGNVVEWCQDGRNSIGPDPASIVGSSRQADELVDEKNPRILRGGTFVNRPAIVRSAYRLWDAPSGRYTLSGFRVCRSYR